MKKNNQIKNYLRIIKKIEKVRARNNKHWMDLYRLAFKVDPVSAVKKIVKKIISKDQKHHKTC